MNLTTMIPPNENHHRFRPARRTPAACSKKIITSVRDGLREVGITDDQILYEATGTISFSIAALVDGSRIMDMDGDTVVLILTFAKERNGTDLAGIEDGPWMHEYVFGTIDEVFEDKDEDREIGRGEVASRLGPIPAAAASRYGGLTLVRIVGDSHAPPASRVCTSRWPPTRRQEPASVPNGPPWCRRDERDALHRRLSP